MPAVGEWGRLTPTGEPKMAPGGMFAGPAPKADIQKLWDVLELDIPGAAGMQGIFAPALVWQDYNPYPNLAVAPNHLWVFVDDQTTATGEGAFSQENPITSGLRQVLMLYAGGVGAAADSAAKHTPLLSTGVMSG